MFPSNTIVLNTGQKVQLQELASKLGVPINYHTHTIPHVHELSDQHYSSMSTDQWFVDMMEKLVEKVMK